MSWLSKLGRSAKKAVTRPGDWAKSLGRQAGKAYEAVDDYLLPAAGFLVGGPMGAAAGGALAKGIGDGRPDLGRVAGGALGGYAGGQIAGMIPGVGGMAGSMGRGGANAIGNPSIAAIGERGVSSAIGALGGAGGAAGAAAPAAAGGWLGGLTQGGIGGMAKRAGSWALSNPEAILGGIGAYQGYQADKRSEEMDRRAMGLLEEDLGARRPIRDMGIAAMQQMGVQSQPFLGAMDLNNPYARPPGILKTLPRY